MRRHVVVSAVVVWLVAVAARAEEPHEIEQARAALQAAQRHLQAAGDAGPYRDKALVNVNKALQQIDRGLATAERREQKLHQRQAQQEHRRQRESETQPQREQGKTPQ